MLTNFFKIAFRVFTRNSVYTLINVFGLAIGIASSLIIFLYVKNELAYDRFHENADRIYRVVVSGEISDNDLNHALTPAPLANALLKEVEGVENIVRVAKFGAWVITYRDIQYNEDDMIFADPGFFKIFSFGLVRGNADSALVRPKSIVLSESAALKYFQDEDPMGKFLMIENDTTFYEVTGIMKNIPSPSHMHFNFVASMTTYPHIAEQDVWISNFLYTYLLAEENISENELSRRVENISAKYAKPAYSTFLDEDSDVVPVSFELQALRDIHLRSALQSEFESNGNILYVYLFSSLAVILLIVSCLNFINLSTARITSRAKEVSIRKISGSGKTGLIRQFLTESSLLAIIAMVLGLFLSELALPGINRYLGLDLMLSQLMNKWGLLLVIVLIAAIGIISGIFPAIYMSSFDPVKVLKPHNNRRGNRGLMRELLLLFQFFIATGAIIMTVIIFKQYRYMVNKDLGFNTGNMLVIRRPDGLREKLDLYKQVSLDHPGVQSITNSTLIPGINAFTKVPFALANNGEEADVVMDYVFISETFAATYGIPVIEGRFLDEDIPGDTAACVVNETAKEILGTENVIGKTLVSKGSEEQHRYDIIGVTADVSFQTVDNPVRPLVMILMPGNYEGYLSVRLNHGEQESTIQYLREEWMKLTSSYPFVSFYLDRSLQENYQPVRETGRIFFIIAITALLVACLGFYSLVSFRYSQDKYEIGIHKMLGAGIKEILFIQFKYLVVLVMIASVFAWTGAFFLARIWMKDYYDHIFLNPAYFLGSSLALLIVLIITSVYQSYTAASINPAMALKCE